MDEKEKELYDLVQDVESTNIVTQPLFELYATLFSIALTILLFAYPNMIYSQPANLYDNMIDVMPQWKWGVSFFTAAMFKAFGLLFDKNFLRIIGLCASSILYIALAVLYAMNFPSIGAITFSTMAIFSLLSIPIVKYTNIKHKR